MLKTIGHIFRMSSFAAALAIVVSLSIFTVPSFAATTSSQTSRPHEGGCAPAGTYSWTYTGSAKANIPGNGVKTAEASVAANFYDNGRCNVPSVTYKNCNLGPRLVVTENPTNCSVDSTRDLSGDVWVIGDNSVVYSGVTICTLDVELGTDYYGDYNTYTNTDC